MARLETDKIVEEEGFPVVAIGASAGGIKAMSELLTGLPADTGMAYVYIQHMDPEHVSALPEIFQRSTKMDVREASHGESLKQDTLYVIPPGKDMTIEKGRFMMSAREKENGIYMPVDKFFISLSSNHKYGVVGVLLSGASHDGTIGLKSIKQMGGFTFVQDGSAEFQSMPKAAIAEDAADKVLSAAQIADELRALGTESEIVKYVMQDTLVGIADNDESLQQVIQMIRKSVNVDFSHYKLTTVKRRIIRRMVLNKSTTLTEYLEILKSNQKELQHLYNDLLINVTCFFRDSDTHEYLKKTILPQIIKNKKPGEPLRIWVPACSSGEEAYSLAITVAELVGTKGGSTPVQIFATDLSEQMIMKARLGVFSRNDVSNLSQKRLAQFFTKVDGSYRVIKQIRDLCVFAPHNIFRDPPFSRIDLISCCNLMIYLDNVLQKKILSIFHYALTANGHLILGKSETIGTSGQLFSQLERKFKVYLKKNDGSRYSEHAYKMHELDRQVRPESKRPVINIPDHVDLEKAADDVLLSRFVPPCVVVNQDLDILQFKGSTGKYLEPSPGKASLNLVKMAKPGLAFDLRSTIHKAEKTGLPSRKTGLEFKSGKETHRVNLEVIPLAPEGEEKTFLVIFQEENVPDLKELKASFSKDKIVKKLEEELVAVREDMRSIIEEQQAGNEELQSANEEIVSSNEELQSINEELETSKEELESTNEELMTINAELQVRNEQLSESFEYAQAVFETIRELFIILDKELRVKTVNRSFFEKFKTTEYETEGVFIFELQNGCWDTTEMRNLLNELSRKKDAIHNRTIVINFDSIGERKLLINGARIQQKIHQQEVILLAIEDVTELRTLID
jgi:two-component system, chemotaxis family, CheB/CheR fusion protein